MSILSKLDNFLTLPRFSSLPSSNHPVPHLSVCSSVHLSIHGEHALSNQYVPETIWGSENIVPETLRVFLGKTDTSKTNSQEVC